MAPPKFGDIGKSAKDLLNKEYHHPNTKVELSTKTKEGVAFKVNVANGQKADFETKFNYKPFNATITEKWSTANVLAQTITLNEFLLKGTKLDLDTTFSPSTGALTGKVTKMFSRPHYTTHSCLDLAKSDLTGSAVFGYDNYLLGVQSSFNYNKGVMGKTLAAASFTTPTTSASAVVDVTEKVSVSVFHKVCGDISAGAMCDVANKGGEYVNSFAVGSQCKLANGAAVKAKIDSNKALALSYTQGVGSGANLGLSMLIDTANLNGSVHKVGFNLTMSS